MPSSKVDEDCASHVRLQKFPNAVVVFQPVMSERGGYTVLDLEGILRLKKKPGNGDCLHDKVIPQMVGKLVNLSIS